MKEIPPVLVRMVPPAVTVPRSYVPTSEYVRTYWVPILGPTSVMLGIAMAEEATAHRHMVPIGAPVPLDADYLAARCGVAVGQIPRCVKRLDGYGFGRILDGVLELPTEWPELGLKQVRRLHPRLQTMHADLLAPLDRVPHIPVGVSAALTYCVLCDKQARAWSYSCPGRTEAS